MQVELIAGKTLTDWSGEWRHLPGGLRHVHIDLSTSVGVYRVLHLGAVVYLGCATEHGNGGLMKRLRDFTRRSASARSHHAGGLIYEHRDEVEIEVLVTGDDAAAALIAKQLKTRFLKRKLPDWNVQPSKQSVLDGTRRSVG
jgi:hypothetical protein